MAETVVYFQYDGEWEKKDDGSYEWCSMNEDLKSIILDDVNSVDFCDFVDNIRKRLIVNKSTYLKLSYISSISKTPRPKYILDDIDVKCYLLDRCLVSQRRSVLHIELVEKNECDEDESNERYEKKVEEVLQDDYFDVDIEAPRVYDAASAQGQKGDILDEPISDQTLHREAMASVPTPDSKPKHLNMDVVVDHCEILATDNCCTSYSYEDGMNITVGQEFKSKEEVKNSVIDASLKVGFDFKIIKSTKTLFVVKCVDEDCKWRLRAAAIAKSSSNFSVRTYDNRHSCSSNSVDRRNRQATASLVADMLRKEFTGRLDTLTPKTIMNMMQIRGVTISYNKAWRGKQMAASDIRASSFQQMINN